jgi:hypothetical protein
VRTKRSAIGLGSSARLQTAKPAGARSRTGRVTTSVNGSPVTTDAGDAAITCPAHTAANRSSKPVMRAPIRGGRPSRWFAERPELAGDRVEIVDPGERLVAQFLHRQLGAFSERMIGGEHGDARVLEEPLAGQAVGRKRQPHERHVGLAAADAPRRPPRQSRR